MRFIDLYAGIGGFRYALESFGHKCVFSAEKDKFAIETYYKNFPDHNPSFDMDILSTMTNDQIDKIIPDHDILCAGFPCQTFSVGGNKKGFNEARGTQFFNVLRVLEAKKPRHILLENVKHITMHDEGKTYRVIIENLRNLGYDIGDEPTIVSPEAVGVPHRRERSFMYATLGEKHINIVVPENKTFKNAIDFVIDKNVSVDEWKLDEKTDWIVNAWNDFISFAKYKPPVIWLDEMLNDTWNEDWQDWKKRYVTKMREFYSDHKKEIDSWLKKTKIMSITNVKYRRFEWLCGDNYDFTLKDKILTIRQSGLRVSKPTVFPTLVASVETPIYFDKKNAIFRYMSTSEMGKLQSFPKKFTTNKTNHQAYKQFGNSVNVDVVKFVVKELKWDL